MLKKRKIKLSELDVRSFVTSFENPARAALLGGSIPTLSLNPAVNCTGRTGGGGVSDESQCCPHYND